MTVSPYLGVGSLQPAFDLAAAHGAGVFVLAATSNPEGRQVQHAATADGRSVAQAVVDELAGRNSRYGTARIARRRGRGDLEPPRCRSRRSSTARSSRPGIGAQGGTPEDVRQLFGGAPAVLPSVSRSVLREGPVIEALRSAVARQVELFAFLRG